MTSYYLTAEAAAKREAALIRRIAATAIPLDGLGYTWLPDDDYWKLPERMQTQVRQAVAAETRG